MRKIIFIFLNLFILSFSLSAVAQIQDGNEDFFTEATQAFENGFFQESDSLLTTHIRQLSGEKKVQAYRLLALSALNQDNPIAAEEYTHQLLLADPYYTAYNDSPRFVDLLEKLKKGKTTVSTASKLKETVEEAPVPITLITEDMINTSGARTLSELLLLYIPGLSQIASIEDNVAMRGIYGMSQETMLVMLDGHRLNSPSTNASALDYRINMDKIKQIEVLRGPASSLYGNVALTAVINIITKSGAELTGGKASFSAGSFNSYGGAFTIGNGNLKSEFLVWGSIYNSKGQEKLLDGTTHYLGGYNNLPTYDIGAKIRWGDFNVQIVAQHAKPVPYHNLLDLADKFSYYKYAKSDGERPGMSRNNIRVDLDYSHSWDKFTLSASGFAAKENLAIYNVLGDEVDSTTAQLLAAFMQIPTIITEGVWQSISWTDFSFGASVSGSYEYKGPGNSFGALIVGAQYENVIPTTAMLRIGADYSDINRFRADVLNDTLEHIISGYLQLKHNITEKLIFNGGLRYDHKIRDNDQRLNTWSPRVSFIWLPSNVLSLKAGFSHSFVDAPLFYRASNIVLFSGGQNMTSETMNALQCGATFNWKKLHLKYDVNLFYNALRNLVFVSGKNVLSGNGTFGGIFANSGKINMGGIENIIQYSNNNTLANLNFTYQYPFTVEDFASSGHNVVNTPKFLANLVVGQKLPFLNSIGSFQLRGNLHFQGAMKYLENDFINDLIHGAFEEEQPSFDQDSYLTVGLGAEWESKFGLKVSFDTHNLFNANYYYGGQMRNGLPGQGRSITAKVSYEF